MPNKSLDKSRFVLLDLRDLLAGGRSLFAMGKVGEPMIVDSAMYAEVLTPASIPDEIELEFITPTINFAKGCPVLPHAITRARGFTDMFQLTQMISNRVALLWQLYGNDWPGQADFHRWQNRLTDASKRIEIHGPPLVLKREYRFSKISSNPSRSRDSQAPFSLRVTFPSFLAF